MNEINAVLDADDDQLVHKQLVVCHQTGAHPTIREVLETETDHQCCGDDQPGVGDQTVMLKGRFIPVDVAAILATQKVPPDAR